MKTLKYEEIYRNDYRNLEDTFDSLGEFIEKIYNEKRPHSALGYRPPVEFEVLPPHTASGVHSAL